MKKIILTSIAVLTLHVAQAQIQAVTSDGAEVILNEDGTWHYAQNVDSVTTAIVVNETPFIKDEQATFPVNSKKLPLQVFMNAKKWRFEKAAENEDAEFSFQLKDKDGYGMIITEKIEIPLDNLKLIALRNAKGVAPDTRLVHEEYRTVNGTQVLCMQMAGTIDGIKFTYFGYYYSDTNGSMQFITYTSTSMFDTLKPDLEKLLNGLVIKKG